MGMKIAINAHFFKYPATGIGQYLIHLANTLIESDPQNEYLILTPGSSAPAGFRHPKKYAARPLPAWVARHANSAQFIWEQWYCPAAAQQARAAIVHYPYLAAPLWPRIPTIVTVPDMIHFRLSHYLEGTAKKLYLQLNRKAAARAAMIITLSEHARQDIIELMQLPPERVRVVYIAAGDEYRPVLDPVVQKEVRARYGLGERYIFYLGGLDQRKNVLQLVRAFARFSQRLADPTLQLFIAGDPAKCTGPLFPDPRPLAAALGVSERIVYRFVAEQDKAALYSGAGVFVFPSLYEGFGLTPLEAMKCGAPVICSNRTSLPEVVGDAALSLDPADTEALSAAMYEVLTNEGLRTDLCRRSLQRAQLFTWQKTAAETLAVYEEVFTTGKGGIACEPYPARSVPLCQSPAGA